MKRRAMDRVDPSTKKQKKQMCGSTVCVCVVSVASFCFVVVFVVLCACVCVCVCFCVGGGRFS